jgi:signal transduction histidine kinase/ActR/RegA family two-component response regulator
VHIGTAGWPAAIELELSERARIPIDANGLKRCVGGELVYEPEAAEVAVAFPQRLASGGLHSLVIAPLRVESKVFGVLIAARRASRSFSSGECEFLKHLSEHVALAAHQVELNSALQRAYDDLRQTQDAVMQQERLRALGQMASGIAHDINNAISPLLLLTESLIETEPGLSVRSQRHLKMMRRAVTDVAQTVGRLREFYRKRESQQEQTQVDVNSVVGQVIDMTRARWSDMPQQRGVVIALTTDLGGDLPCVMGVESELREIMINLVFNAVDAMPDGGRLALRTRVVDGSEKSGSELRSVTIEVIDSGVGMDEETQMRCAEPFFSTKGDRGTGLGLAMVYGIAKRHGADLEIESAPGAGTTVRLTFAAARMADSSVETEMSSAPPIGLRILVIDDDPLVLRALREVLEIDGHLVVTANEGKAGIEEFRSAQERREPFATVLTDLGMPHMDGRQVARAIKEASPGTPVILVTGWGQRLLADGDIPPHVDRVLSKPPKLRELREALLLGANAERVNALR